MICAGIDAGSRAIKVVLWDADRLAAVASGVAAQGVEQEALAHALFERLLEESGLTRDHVSHVVATGYGRDAVGFADTTVTEITCHASGVRHLVPEARTVIDIGGQDSKLIRLDSSGSVRDFVMNDRCAAGTGRFIEIVAERLGLALTGLGEAAVRSTEPAAISSTCVVFAETEIIGLLTAGTRPEDIVAGVQASIASRVASMAGRGIDAPVVFTGGVAMIPGMDRALQSALAHPVVVAPEPQMSGALGAALEASRTGDGP